MLVGFNVLVIIVVITMIFEKTATVKRKKRYLLLTKDTQWGVYLTVSLPLETDAYVSVAWFFEASYYGVDNATWFEPLLGDIYTISRDREDRSIEVPKGFITRKIVYVYIESMLERHGYPGRACLLRAICDNADAHFLHNGLLGDLLYFILTPSTSMSEDDIEDCYYEAEYYGLDKQCECYHQNCPSNPLEKISLYAENVI